MKYLNFFLLICLTLPVYAQRNIHVEFKGGMIFPVGQDLSKIYDQGFTFQIGMPTKVAGDIFLSPYLTTSHLANKPYDGFTESFKMYGVGMGTGTYLPFGKKNKLRISSMLRVSYNRYSDDLLIQKPFISSSSKKEQNVFHGALIAKELSLGVLYKKLLLEVSYNFAKDAPTLGKETIEGIERKHGLYQLYKVVDISSISMNYIILQIGFFL